MKSKQKIIIGLAISLLTFININTAFANYNWKDYFSFEQMTALKKDTNQSVINQLRTASDWKGVIKGRNIAAGAISASKLSSNGCSSGQFLKWDGTTWSCSSSAVPDGFITNAKIASDAAIVGSKISPDFGAQNITTTGSYEIGGITALKSDASLWNTFVGLGAGGSNTTGDSNTFVGDSSGGNNTIGSSNTFLGRRSGVSNTSGGSNTFIGMASGFSNINGQGNVFIGNQSGANETGSNKLYIANGVTTSSTSLIYGEFNATPASQILALGGGGNVGIGTTSPSQKLSVAGTIESTSGGIKFPDGTTQTTAAKSSATLCTASTGTTTTCGIFSLCAIAKVTDTASNSHEYGNSCELTDTAGTWTLESNVPGFGALDCKAYCL